MSPTTNEDLKRPYGPERHQSDKASVLANDSDLLLQFELSVITEQATPVRTGIVRLRHQLLGGGLGKGIRCPDLAMRVRIAGTHHRSPIFEDLHVSDPRKRPQFSKLRGPGAHHLLDFARLHRRQREIVSR